MKRIGTLSLLSGLASSAFVAGISMPSGEIGYSTLRPSLRTRNVYVRDELLLTNAMARSPSGSKR